MRIDVTGLDFIKSFEGFSDVKYVCPGGYATIGYGHLVRPGDDVPGEITKNEAHDLLIKDALLAELAVAKFINVSLTQGQHNALTSFVFNLGAGALQRSTLRRVVNRSDHDDVPAEFMKWTWAGGRRLSGLARRRYAESVMYAK